MTSTNLEIAENEFMQSHDLKKCEVCRAYYDRDDMFYVPSWDEWFCENHIENAIEMMKKENADLDLQSETVRL